MSGMVYNYAPSSEEQTTFASVGYRVGAGSWSGAVKVGIYSGEVLACGPGVSLDLSTCLEPPGAQEVASN